MPQHEAECHVNNYSYTVAGAAEFGIRAGLNFLNSNFSTDNQYVIGHRGVSADCTGCNNSLAKPSYVAAEEYPNWPHLSNAEAIALTSIRASSNGAGDGWLWSDQ